jgi:hypothetical protein
MKRFVLLLPLAVAGCGDEGIQAKLDRCKDGIRTELAALLDKIRREAAEGIEALEPAGEPTDTARQRSNEMIKALPGMFAAMAGPIIEARLQELEPTQEGLAWCEAVLAQARQGVVRFQSETWSR